MLLEFGFVIRITIQILISPKNTFNDCSLNDFFNIFLSILILLKIYFVYLQIEYLSFSH